MKFDEKIYELILEKELPDVASKGYLFKHKKSGARVAIVSNDDENKVFNIGFRTPPTDSTGVPHILEHSVLCGSEKYPAKDPFVELCKGSLNTFLNAMTYPDKTIYPIASCNDVDYKNLTDVYLDAVLHPNIYKREQIFKQEGWHYELTDVDAPLTYNGVVYNEMKGAFSSATQRLYRMCLNSLYPDTAYATESGGDPEFIPDLSYEKFLEFHKKLYHPSNSYIYFYGNCDMEERLEYLDREYLSKYDAIEVDSKLELQAPFESTRRVEGTYSVTEQEGTKDKTYLAYNASIGQAGDMELSVAFSILEYALFTAPGAPVKQALIDAGIGQDVNGSYDDSILQPMVTIFASNTNVDKEEEFVKVIKDTLKKVVSEGINKDTLTAGINSAEFRYREADFGRWPKGLLYGMNMLNNWLHDDMRPFDNMQVGKIYEFLRSQIDTDYFERLVEKYLLDNTHSSLVVLKPEVGYVAKVEAAVAKKLDDYKKTLSNEELVKIIEDTKALKQYQSEPSTKEELEKIPLLKREDIRKEAMPFNVDEKKVLGATVLHHDYNTNGIAYMVATFNLDKVEDELLPYAALLSRVLCKIGTKKHTFSELSNEIDKYTGGLSAYTVVTQMALPNKDYKISFNFSGKSLYGEFKTLMGLVEEVVNQSVLDDYKRVKEIIGENKTNMQMRMQSSGNAVAMEEILAQKYETGAINKAMTGRGFYKFIDNLYNDFDAGKEEVIAKMKEAAQKIFTKENFFASITCNAEGYTLLENEIRDFVAKLPDTTNPVVSRHYELKKERLGLVSSGQVCYVCRGGEYANVLPEYKGTMMILETAMGYDYLWNNVRVKGGAYGCGANLGSATMYAGGFSSYRDPNLEETNKIYEGVPEYVKNFDADEREMTKYVIGTISNMDVPLTPSAKGTRALSMYGRGITFEMLQKQRDEVLNATVEDIRALEAPMKAILDDGYFCVVGSEEKINKSKDMFDVIENLI